MSIKLLVNLNLNKLKISQLLNLRQKIIIHQFKPTHIQQTNQANLGFFLYHRLSLDQDVCQTTTSIKLTVQPKENLNVLKKHMAQVIHSQLVESVT